MWGTCSNLRSGIAKGAVENCKERDQKLKTPKAMRQKRTTHKKKTSAQACKDLTTKGKRQTKARTAGRVETESGSKRISKQKKGQKKKADKGACRDLDLAQEVFTEIPGTIRGSARLQT